MKVINKSNSTVWFPDIPEFKPKVPTEITDFQAGIVLSHPDLQEVDKKVEPKMELKAIKKEEKKEELKK